MHEDHFAARRKDKIGLSRQLWAMQPVTVSHSMNKAAHQHLGLHALTLDAPHIFGTALGGELVSHCQLADHASSSHKGLFSDIAWGHGYHFFAVQPGQMQLLY